MVFQPTVGWLPVAAALLVVAGCSVAPAEKSPAAEATPAPRPSLPVAVGAPDDISRTLAAVFARANIPGGVAVVLRGDRIVAQGAAGVRKRGTDVPVTIDDEFEICSCAKAMTATVVASFVDEGKLTWSTSLAEIFRDSVPNLDPAWRHVSVLQMLQHRAGLHDHLMLLARTTLFAKDEAPVLRRKLAATILSRPPDFTPGEKFFYESAGYLILGAALEKISGRTWHELMRERLFEPLGLSSAGFGPPGAPGKVDQPWGHGPRWFVYLPLPGSSNVAFDPGSRHADFPAVAEPAGLVHMSVVDWAKFVALHLRSDPANPHRDVALLTSDSFATLHGTGVTEEYAGGWFTSTRPWAKGARDGDRGRVLFHSGDNNRWSSSVWVAPEIDFAILIVCNRASMWRQVDEIASKLVAAYAPRAPKGARQ